jgi:hypothetical protein
MDLGLSVPSFEKLEVSSYENICFWLLIFTWLSYPVSPYCYNILVYINTFPFYKFWNVTRFLFTMQVSVSDGTLTGGVLSISEADLQVSRHRISVFLTTHTAYELLPQSGKVWILYQWSSLWHSYFGFLLGFEISKSIFS